MTFNQKIAAALLGPEPLYPTHFYATVEDLGSLGDLSVDQVREVLAEMEEGDLIRRRRAFIWDPQTGYRFIWAITLTMPADAEEGEE